MTTEAENKAIPIEDLMDASIDAIADLPAFVVPPIGFYKLGLSLERKAVNDKPCVQANFVVLETKELKNASDVPVEVGTKFNSLYMMDNQFGQGAFKALVAPLAGGLGLQGAKVSEVIQKVQNVQITATLKHRKDKEDKERVYPNIQDPQLA